MKELYAQLGISSAGLRFLVKLEESLKERFEKFDKTAEYNQMKVIHAMQKNRVSEECFGSSSGYGYNDLTDAILWKRFMRIHSTQKHAWCARRSPAEPMHLPLLFWKLTPGR